MTDNEKKITDLLSEHIEICGGFNHNGIMGAYSSWLNTPKSSNKYRKLVLKMFRRGFYNVFSTKLRTPYKGGYHGGQSWRNDCIRYQTEKLKRA